MAYDKAARPEGGFKSEKVQWRTIEYDQKSWW